MKLLIASDIHGDIESARVLVEEFEKRGCDKILLLGDVLYHGPRNNLPDGYAPKEVIALLNKYKDVITCVRGNCDAEVDQMVLEFPIMADYAILNIDGLNIFATHGHHFNTENPPKLAGEEILLHGHTHLLTIEKFGDNNTYINPGSASIPKGGNPATIAIYDDRCFKIIDRDGKLVKNVAF